MKVPSCSTFRILLIAFFIPIISIVLAVGGVKWYAENISSNKELQDVDWGKAIAASPDVRFEITDSLKCYRYEERMLLKNEYITVAYISHLFPQFDGTILLHDKQSKLLDYKEKQGSTHHFEVRTSHGGVYYGDIERESNGKFYLTTKTSVGTPKKIYLGKFKGVMSQNAIGQYIDIEMTSFNVIIFIFFLICLIGGIIGILTPNPWHGDKYLVVNYIGTANGLIVTVFALYIVTWLFGMWEFDGMRSNYPEWITLAWVLCEFSLLSNIYCRLIVPESYDEAKDTATEK